MARGRCDIILEAAGGLAYDAWITKPFTTPPSWRKSLERSKAQVTASETVPLLPVLDRLRASRSYTTTRDTALFLLGAITLAAIVSLWPRQ